MQENIFKMKILPLKNFGSQKVLPANNSSELYLLAKQNEEGVCQLDIFEIR